MTDLLTPAEHDAVAMAAELWNHLQAIVADGPSRAGDLSELIFHVHAIQRAVLKQAAARAYPDLYRLLGAGPPGTPPARDRWPGPFPGISKFGPPLADTTPEG